ncbi:MAG TPA: hypothetical protein VEQ63_01335 [Bryobacteraceae bacterium]|nr:hypothetical protein [Bryobacteraceae bacterium]
MDRRSLLLTFIAAPAWLPAAGEPSTVRGKLVRAAGDAPGLQAVGGPIVALTGDEDTVAVLKDQRLSGLEFEVRGKKEAPDRFTVDPIHTRAMFVHKDASRLMVTYWCDVCAIRTYRPGLCWCCRDETELQLLPPEQVK